MLLLFRLYGYWFDYMVIGWVKWLLIRLYGYWFGYMGIGSVILLLVWLYLLLFWLNV